VITKTTADKDTAKVYQTKENVFEGLRGIAFSTTPERLGILLPSDKVVIYAAKWTRKWKVQ